MSDRKFALQLLATLFLLAFAGFWIEAAWDFSRSLSLVTHEPLRLAELRPTPQMVRTLGSSIATTYNTQIALLLTFIALAIPLTANFYTPKLIEIFVRDRINLAVLCGCALLAGHALFAVSLSFDAWVSELSFFVAVAAGVFGWILLLPYYFYVLTFVDPMTIIKRVHRQLKDELESAARGRQPVAAAQQQVNQRIVNLGSVLLRAVDRSDREVTFEAIKTHIIEFERVREVKRRLPEAFFEVGNGILVGASQDAVDIISRSRIWMEYRLATHLMLAFRGLLGRMPDGVSVMAVAVMEAARAEAAGGDHEVFRLLVRMLNSFTREAIKKKDNGAAYNVVFNYKLLLRALLETAPQQVPRLVAHLRFYAQFARAQGLPFIYELVSYELASLCESACERGVASSSSLLLEALLDLKGVESSAALVKSRTMLAGYFEEKGRVRELSAVEATLHVVPNSLLAEVRQDLLALDDAVFWEMTDRGTNFDYVEPRRREAVLRVLDRCVAVGGAAG